MITLCDSRTDYRWCSIPQQMWVTRCGWWFRPACPRFQWTFHRITNKWIFAEVPDVGEKEQKGHQCARRHTFFRWIIPLLLFEWLTAVAVGKGHREDAAILTKMWMPHSADRERRCLPTFFRLCTLCKNRALMKALSKIFIDIIIMWFYGFMCIWNIYKIPELLS